jgi:hypothetical protein
VVGTLRRYIEAIRIQPLDIAENLVIGDSVGDGDEPAEADVFRLVTPARKSLIAEPGRT